MWQYVEPLNTTTLRIDFDGFPFGIVLSHAKKTRNMLKNGTRRCVILYYYKCKLKTASFSLIA